MDCDPVQLTSRLAKIFTDADQLPGVIEIATNVVAVRERIGVDLSFFEKVEELAFSRRGRCTSLSRTVSHYPLRLANPARR
jgi:hypothetical protein